MPSYPSLNLASVKNKSPKIALLKQKEINISALEGKQLAMRIFTDFGEELYHLNREQIITKLNLYRIYGGI